MHKPVGWESKSKDSNTHLLPQFKDTGLADQKVNATIRQGKYD